MNGTVPVVGQPLQDCFLAVITGASAVACIIALRRGGHQNIPCGSCSKGRNSDRMVLHSYGLREHSSRSHNHQHPHTERGKQKPCYAFPWVSEFVASLLQGWLHYVDVEGFEPITD